jgi:drug/metabolite transporter (DMT)-like permease
MMTDGWLEVVGVLYGATGVVVVASYALQIRAVWRSEQAAGVCLPMWLLWFATAFIGMLYAAFIARERGTLWMSSANALGCALVVAATAWRRWGGSRRWRRRGAQRLARRLAAVGLVATTRAARLAGGRLARVLQPS